mmetsp:Transcript_41008/g.113986  ORF Transcript_41008/g.113986 Transcript_41008/m.113986 type:complete len:219 (+) Transcript_41008:1066-1722(+)
MLVQVADHLQHHHGQVARLCLGKSARWQSTHQLVERQPIKELQDERCMVLEGQKLKGPDDVWMLVSPKHLVFLPSSVGHLGLVGPHDLQGDHNAIRAPGGPLHDARGAVANAPVDIEPVSQPAFVAPLLRLQTDEVLQEDLADQALAHARALAPPHEKTLAGLGVLLGALLGLGRQLRGAPGGALGPFGTPRGKAGAPAFQGPCDLTICCHGCHGIHA